MNTIELSNSIITEIIDNRYKQVTTDFFISGKIYPINIDSAIFEILLNIMSEIGQDI